MMTHIGVHYIYYRLVSISLIHSSSFIFTNFKIIGSADIGKILSAITPLYFAHALGTALLYGGGEFTPTTRELVSDTREKPLIHQSTTATHNASSRNLNPTPMRIAAAIINFDMLSAAIRPYSG